MKEKEVTAEVEISKIIEKVWAPLLTILVVAGVGYGAYLGYTAYSLSQESKAQEELFAIQKRAENIEKDLNTKAQAAVTAKADKKNKKAMPEKTEPAKIVKTAETLASNYAEVLKDYEDFISKNHGKKAALMAAVQLAGLATDYNDLPRAEKTLRAVVSTSGERDIFYSLVRSQLGTVLMEQNNFKEAAEVFGQIVNNKSQASFHPQALLRLGVCHMENGDFDKAVNTFTRLSADHPKTQAASEARGLKRLATLKKGANS
jgi:predicted negative regulator of RcsB-dependent stress response